MPLKVKGTGSSPAALVLIGIYACVKSLIVLVIYLCTLPYLCKCLSGRCGEKDTACAGVCVTVLHRGVTADGNVQGIWCKSHKTELSNATENELRLF